MILENGGIFERTGCGFSHVNGAQLPPSATQTRPDLKGAPFEAMGVSLVFHPRNPYVPTVHMNVQPNAHNGHQNRPLGMRSYAGPFDLLVVFGSSPNHKASL
jgi:coproporphyrinogen III oxidase